MSDFDQLCKCGARFGEHGAPIPRCPNGDGFRRNEYFEPTPARRERFLSERELLIQAAKEGVQPLWQSMMQMSDDGTEAVVGAILANRSEIEAAARRWRQRPKQPQPTLDEALAVIGDGGER